MSNKNFSPDDLKLIYVMRSGLNHKHEGIYELIFSCNETNVNFDEWGWDINPADGNAQPPDVEYIDAVYTLKISSFQLSCLNESVYYEYTFGYNNIIALAYEIPNNEIDGFEDYEELFENENVPLLVLHYGYTLQKIKDLLYDRGIILKGTEFVEPKNITI